MKRKLAAVTVATLLSSSASFGAGYASLGYAMAKTDDVSRNGVTFDIGARFGETIKQGLGMKYIFVGKNEDLSDGTGNILDFYYMI